MYLLCENDIFLVILSLPTSNKEFSKYIKRLLSKGKKSSDVVTKFSLKKAVNKTEISYSQVQFVMERALTPDENELVNKMAEQVKIYTKGNKTTTALSDLPKDKNAHQQMETNIIKIINLELEIDSEVQRLIDVKSDISKLIKRAENDEHRLILELRYLHLKKWGEIAQIMGYGVDNVYKIHRCALKKLKFPESLQ